MEGGMEGLWEEGEALYSEIKTTPCKLHYQILSVCTGGQEGRERGRKEGMEGWWGQEGRLRTLKEKFSKMVLPRPSKDYVLLS